MPLSAPIDFSAIETNFEPVDAGRYQYIINGYKDKPVAAGKYAGQPMAVVDFIEVDGKKHQFQNYVIAPATMWAFTRDMLAIDGTNTIVADLINANSSAADILNAVMSFQCTLILGVEQSKDKTGQFKTKPDGTPVMRNTILEVLGAEDNMPF